MTLNDRDGALLISAARLITCVASEGGALGALDRGAVLIDGGRVIEVGPADRLRARHSGARLVEHGGLVTPGLVDAHTHAAWVGSRAGEYAMRMAGADYEAIAAAGGGILASTRAVRGASVEQIADELRARLRRMASLGVTAVEVKSGYGLSYEAERRQLEAIALAAGDASLPRVVPTFLGLHAAPPESPDRASHAAACRDWLERLAGDGLMAFVDAYVDRSAFSVAEVRPVLERAREMGIGVRLHAGQFAEVGGAELAAELGAASVDHLEHVSPAGLAALARAGVHAVLLPVASFTLRQSPPDVAALREAGVPIVVASDANPGTAPTESLPLAMSLAAGSYGLSLDEIVLGATRRAAESLSLDAGALRPGAPADLVLWNLTNEAELIQPWGVAMAHAVVRGGRQIAV